MIDRTEFGRTGHQSSRVIFGAAGLSKMSQDDSDRVLEVLLEFGVNHIDTAASYGDSELRVGPWMAKYRDQFFLATKTGDRSGPEARASLERSLVRLGVERVDMIQLHNLVEEDEWQAAFAPGGAVEALAKARDEGLTRFIGVTGHGLRIAAMHQRSLGRFDFDAVLLPYNFALLQNDQYRADLEALLETCAQRRTAVQTIKSVARRRWRPEDTSEHRSWYEPLARDEQVGRAVQFVLGRPQLFLNSSSDTRLLRTILTAASQAASVPADAYMRADADSAGIEPLFDGGVLERI